jgi:xanthine dehydrogenase molybdopterin-binding subunit B
LVWPPQIIGVVVAETEPLARRAAKAVVVDYEDLPAVIRCVLVQVQWRCSIAAAASAAAVAASIPAHYAPAYTAAA